MDSLQRSWSENTAMKALPHVWQARSQFWPGLLLILFALFLAGCAGQASPPVVDRQHGGVAPVRANGKTVKGGQYRVAHGDTLYSIAFKYGKDWKQLAGINGIQPPYTIKPGQLISLSPRSAAARQQIASSSRATASAQPPVAAVQPVKTSPPAAGTPAVRTETAVKPATPSAKPVVKTDTASAVKPVASTPAPASGKWLWPTSGTVVKRFSSATNLNKGIDIAGGQGQPVVATAKGVVVYAGNGLLGYGELLIIKHDEIFISAYGHNRKLLVNEGQQVNAGQQIAEMGSTGTDQVKLHFEIRRKGIPVDPLGYLPKR